MLRAKRNSQGTTPQTQTYAMPTRAHRHWQSPGAGLELGRQESRGKTHTDRTTPVMRWGWQEHTDHQPWAKV